MTQSIGGGGAPAPGEGIDWPTGNLASPGDAVRRASVGRNFVIRGNVLGLIGSRAYMVNNGAAGGLDDGEQTALYWPDVADALSPGWTGTPLSFWSMRTTGGDGSLDDGNNNMFISFENGALADSAALRTYFAAFNRYWLVNFTQGIALGWNLINQDIGDFGTDIRFSLQNDTTLVFGNYNGLQLADADDIMFAAVADVNYRP